MLSINTNISSLVAQNSMKSATQLLNQAVERMTTGYKINHAKDNAANYSISTNMQMQISSYDVAADNVAMGMDLVTTASDIIANMQDKANRLQALCTQARNGTYGAQSLSAINTEAGAIMAEITRLYQTAEYNKINLFDKKPYELTAEHQALTESLQTNNAPKAENDGFIADPKHPNGDAYVDGLTSVTEAIDSTGLTSGGEYKVASKEDLIALAEYVNDDNPTSNITFIMSEDIDLSSISNWTPIGYLGNAFEGTFDGNGHVIKNLTIDSTDDYQGLFGYTDGEIKNVGLEGVNIKGGNSVGGLVGETYGSITNSYATGAVTGTGFVGGLAGVASGITNSYATGAVTANDYVGGLAGEAYGSITNSYATGSVTGTGDNIGGLVGNAYDTITNSYATGAVTGNNYVSGLVGCIEGSITNSYATGAVTGNNYVGGLVGCIEGSITNSYATGAVTGNGDVGGLVGQAYGSITNSYATGAVTGNSSVGGLVGHINESTIIDSASYSTKVSGTNRVGALIGYVYDWDSFELSNTSAMSTSLPSVGYYYDDSIGDENPDKAKACDEVVKWIMPKVTTTTLQVGINGDESCRLTFDTNFEFDLSSVSDDIASDEALNTITEFLNLMSEKSTMLGAVQNRLDSALDSIEVNMTNLTSSLSTIRDADIAEVSSHYIQQQILQQASATLLATANQSPSIALQLI